MSTIAHIPAPAVLTQAHRDAIAHIQDLAISVSLQGVYAVDLNYDGNTNLLSVFIRNFSDIAKGCHRSCRQYAVWLPGALYAKELASRNALPELQEVASELENLLTPPDGDAA